MASATRSRSAVRPAVRETMAALDPGWRARLGDDHLVEIDALAAIADFGAHPRSGHHHRREWLAHHLRAGPQSDLPVVRRRARLSLRRQAPRRRHVRDRLFRLPGLPRRRYQGDAGGAHARHRPALRHPYPADVDRQGGDLRTRPGRAAPPSSTSFSKRPTPAISATARTGIPGAMAAASARPAACGRTASPNGNRKNDPASFARQTRRKNIEGTVLCPVCLPFRWPIT